MNTIERRERAKQIIGDLTAVYATLSRLDQAYIDGWRNHFARFPDSDEATKLRLQLLEECHSKYYGTTPPARPDLAITAD